MCLSMLPVNNMQLIQYIDINSNMLTLVKLSFFLNQMADEREETVEEQGSTQGEDNRDQRLETMLARMADFFERQGNR